MDIFPSIELREIISREAGIDESHRILMLGVEHDASGIARGSAPGKVEWVHTFRDSVQRLLDAGLVAYCMPVLEYRPADKLYDRIIVLPYNPERPNTDDLMLHAWGMLSAGGIMVAISTLDRQNQTNVAALWAMINTNPKKSGVVHLGQNVCSKFRAALYVIHKP